ncbi:hypothetical protein BK784_27090 [Bacillus thuringiensis serovar medellin]|uniref:Bacterial sugar transferase domain-containing protein n=1 Tax=Bacillus thuringiensis subsp. medellin TaxID=79672 RepID=A0A9X6MXT8_BACTV|nr:sugar transferase [Bacillus thuringiensis]OUB88996.1 hypothetical protein BK784_27090 [Bacillus thuringiensis serovar medellin]
MADDITQTKSTPTVIQNNKSILYQVGKRTFDVIFSLFMLVIILPILSLFCVIIPLESPGSPFFCQERLGKNGKRYIIYKLRSMCKNAEPNGPQWAQQDDERITKIGKFIRRTRIDELPQFINILKGDMSIVGPRPERQFFYDKFKECIPDYKDRLVIKPGLTGWAQINGGYNITPQKKLSYDLNYIKHRTFRLDLYIIYKTIFIILSGDGAR